MIPYNQISESILKQRYATLPDAVKRALDTPASLDAATHACQNHHVADGQKILMVQQLVAFVLLGIIHWYDLGKEINDALELNNPKLATSLAEEIGVKIFAPIKSELESSFHPLIAQPTSIATQPVPTPAKPAGPPPRVMTEIKAPQTAFQEKKDEAPLPPAPKISQPDSSSPQPVFIHQEITSAPVQNVAFKPALPADQHIRDAKFNAPTPVRPARVELGAMPNKPTVPSAPSHTPQVAFSAPKPAIAPQPTAPAHPLPQVSPQKPLTPLTMTQAAPPSSPARVVHYTDFKTPVAAPQTTNTAPSLPRSTTPTPAMLQPKPEEPRLPQKPAAPPVVSTFAQRAPEHRVSTTKEGATISGMHPSPPAATPLGPVPPPPPPPPASNTKAASPVIASPAHPTSPLQSQRQTPQELVDTEALRKVTESYPETTGNIDTHNAPPKNMR